MCVTMNKNPFLQFALQEVSNATKCASWKNQRLQVVQIASLQVERMISTKMDGTIFVITATPSMIQPKGIGMGMALLMRVRAYFQENESIHFYSIDFSQTI